MCALGELGRRKSGDDGNVAIWPGGLGPWVADAGVDDHGWTDASMSVHDAWAWDDESVRSDMDTDDVETKSGIAESCEKSISTSVDSLSIAGDTVCIAPNEPLRHTWRQLAFR